MRYNVPVFDPFGDRGDDYFHPANDAADHKMQAYLAHRDIAALFGILNRTDDEYDAKLLTKFMVVEFLSLDEHIAALVGLALSGRTGYPLSAEEATELKRLNAAYTALQKPAEPALREIRNKSAAHRDSGSLLSAARIWDGLDAGVIHQMSKPIVALCAFLKDLNIYQWTKRERTKDGLVTAYVSPMRWDNVVIERMEDSPSDEVSNS